MTIGRFPVRGELSILPTTRGPSLAEVEFKEHGSIALRRLVHVRDPEKDNTIDATWTLVVGGAVLVRGRNGGFYHVGLEQDSAGWFVTLGGALGSPEQVLRVVFDPMRERWVVRELPGDDLA